MLHLLSLIVSELKVCLARKQVLLCYLFEMFCNSRVLVKDQVVVLDCDHGNGIILM